MCIYDVPLLTYVATPKSLALTFSKIVEIMSCCCSRSLCYGWVTSFSPANDWQSLGAREEELGTWNLENN